MRNALRAARCVGLAIAVAALPSSAQAAIVQIGSFSSSSGDYTYSAGTLSGTTSGVFTFDSAFASLFSVSALPQNATLSINATATSTVSGSPFASQTMDGTVTVLDSSSNVLVSATFTGAFFGGLLGSTSATLTGDTALGTTISYSSNVWNSALAIDPKTLNFNLTPLSAALAVVSGGNFANFTSPDIANFSTTLRAIPEPTL
ncbi:MAG: hypothetical protein ACT4QD_23950, partial [Acidobacteriota bacterium]